MKSPCHVFAISRYSQVSSWVICFVFCLFLFPDNGCSCCVWNSGILLWSNEVCVPIKCYVFLLVAVKLIVFVVARYFYAYHIVTINHTPEKRCTLQFKLIRVKCLETKIFCRNFNTRYRWPIKQMSVKQWNVWFVQTKFCRYGTETEDVTNL
jgi:hypothetical protein